MAVLQPTREVIRMDRRLYCVITGIIFIIIVFLHLLRIIYGWVAVIGDWTVPQWISWVALVVAGYLGYEGLRLARRG